MAMKKSPQCKKAKPSEKTSLTTGKIPGRKRLRLDAERLSPASELSQVSYHSLLENSPVAIWEIDVTGIIDHIGSLQEKGIQDFKIYLATHREHLLALMQCLRFCNANKATLDLLRANDLSDLNDNFGRIFHEGLLDPVTEAVAAYIGGRSTIEMESVLFTLKGEKKNVFVRIYFPEIFTDPQKKITGLSIDITGRIRAEEALRENEEKYRIIFQESPISLWEADFSAGKKLIDLLKSQGVRNFNTYFDEHPEAVWQFVSMIRIIDVNDAAVKKFRAPGREYLLNNISAILSNAPFETWKKMLISFAEGAKSFEDETVNYTIDGRKLHISFRMSVPKGYETTLSMILVSSLDITELKKAERDLSKAYGELKKAHDRLEQRVRERTSELVKANRMLAREIDERMRLEQELLVKNRELEDFAFVMSHEVKNNMAHIKRILELSAKKPELLKEYSDALASSSDRLMKFVRNLLTMAKSGKTAELKEKVALDLLLGQIFTMLKPDDVKADMVIQPSLPPVICDREGIERVFTNLISNSLRYLDIHKEALRLEVGYRKESGFIDIIFRDNGVGIPPDTLGKIFDPAFTTMGEEHFGFGLAVVKKIVESHGGLIEAHSEGIGRGVEFVIKLPIPHP